MKIKQFINQYHSQTNLFKLRPILIIYSVILIAIGLTLAIIGFVNFKSHSWFLIYSLFPIMLSLLWIGIMLLQKQLMKIKGLEMKKSTVDFFKYIGVKDVKLNEFKIKRIKQLLKEHFKTKKEIQCIEEIILYIEDGKLKNYFTFSSTFFIAMWTGILLISLNIYFENLKNSEFFFKEYVAIIILSLFLYFLFSMFEFLIRTILERKIDRNKELVKYLREIKMEYLTKHK